MVEFLLRVVVGMAVNVALVMAGFALAPPWRAFVARLSGRAVLLLWGGAVAAMAAAWQMPAGGDAVEVLRIAMFIAPPVLALAVSIERLHGARPPRHQASYGRGR
ncbi:MAG TPA: hypothetical protein VLK84_08800 [Longimicrobium sp.]|nr:hypothetical protein [Longimicrobium sp.]